MTEPRDSVNVPGFSVQLREAYVYEVSVTRRERTESEEAEPSLQAGPGAFNRDDAQHRFSVLVGGDIQFPFGDGLKAVAQVKCSVLGVFTYTGQPDEELLRVFPSREGLIILWPYLRAAVAQVAGMTGLQLPPIPTLDVMATLGNAPESVEPTHLPA
jgi:preprotein translocase subunit SecB